MAAPESLSVSDLSDIVDLERYPITSLDTPAGQRLVRDCRERFEDGVSCELEGFVRPSAVAEVVREVEAREERAFLSARWRGAYGFYGARHGEVPRNPVASTITRVIFAECVLRGGDLETSASCEIPDFAGMTYSLLSLN